MTTSADAPEAPAPSPHVAEAPEPMAEPSENAEGARLSLKVRTLDQKTYPITIGAAASVPQLKELVALETGVTLARQRLIYRGRVLKNDQPLAAYSLEDGHVLHLVARAEPSSNSNTGTSATAPVAATGAANTGTGARVGETEAELNAMNSGGLRGRSRSRSRRLRSPPAPRDNDEPDPTMGRSSSGVPNRLLMGATIAVPEGSDMTMPFLSSMIANLVTQVSDPGAVDGTGAATGDGRRHVSFTRDTVGGEAGGDPTATATSARIRLYRRGRDGSSGRSHSRRSSTSAERQAVLRSRAGLRLDSMRAMLDDAALDFPAELAPLEQGANAGPMAELQQQVETLQTLMERFGPRLRLLPAALAERDRLGDNPSQEATATPATRADSTPVTAPGSSPTTDSSTTAPAARSLTFPVPGGFIMPSRASTPAPVAAPATAASESTLNVASQVPAALAGVDPRPENDAAVSSRHVIRAIETLQTIGESADLLARVARHAFVRQSMHLGEPIPRRGNFSSSSASNGIANAPTSRPATSSFQAEAELLRGIGSDARDPARPRFRLARIRATAVPDGRPITGHANPGVLPGSSSNFPVDLTGTAAPSAPPPPSTSSSSSSRPHRSRSHSRRSAASQSDEGVPPPPPPPPPAGPQISIAGLGGLPVMSSVVFPFSLAAGLNGNHATTTWNLADFVSRLTSELPISTLYGVMAGEHTHLHHFLAHIGFALFSGVDVPRVSRPNIRTWAQDFIDELRDLLRSHAPPSDVLDQITGPGERRFQLGTELINALEPFMPELVDTLVRATSASRAAAFGATSATFLRVMARQVVSQLRLFARGDSMESEDESDRRLRRLLQRTLVWLGLNEHMANFLVDTLITWTGDDSATTGNSRGQTRLREEATATDAPASKRRRE